MILLIYIIQKKREEYLNMYGEELVGCQKIIAGANDNILGEYKKRMC